MAMKTHDQSSSWLNSKLYDSTKAVTRGRCIALKIYIKVVKSMTYEARKKNKVNSMESKE